LFLIKEAGMKVSAEIRTAVITLAIMAAVFGGYLLRMYVDRGGSVSPDAALLVLITLTGAFGGLLYTLRDNGLELPHRDPKHPYVLKLGWIVDCTYGIAGAYVVFLILPTEFANSAEAGREFLSNGAVLKLIRLLALALVGGYGGRSLVDRALANIAKTAEDAQKEASDAKAQVAQMQETDPKALEIVHRHLDKDEPEQDPHQIKAAIKAVSKKACYEILKEGRALRTKTWKTDVPLMERTIPIFEALAEHPDGQGYHRNHAQFGYALKDQHTPNWQRAYQELDTAITLRDREGTAGFLMYEFNRALCGIELKKPFDTIERDLRAAAQSDYVHLIIKNDPTMKEWAQANSYDLVSLQPKQPPAD
jgi:hypothetical protein